MGVFESLSKKLEDSQILKTINEKTTFGLFMAILTGLVGAVGLVGKILDADKRIALWLSKAIALDPSTKAPVLKAWFVPFVFLGIAIASGFLLLIIVTVQRHFAKTDDQIALEEMMGSVRQIRDQGKQTKIKAWKTITLRYLIDKDLSGSLTKISEIQAVDVPVHYWESVNSVEDEADPADSLATIGYRVVDLSSPANSIVYLPSENGRRSKRACLFFLPPIQPGETRKFETFFKWKGMFLRLKKVPEDISFSTNTRDSLPAFRLEVYLEQGSGKSLDCQITSSRYAGDGLTAGTYAVNGWNGSGWVYQATNVPAGSLQFTLRAKLKA
jgi:hypothetical protein